ncbi:MAG: hypothetical protein V4656_17200 [Pseudomonadota bacterium]
MTYAGFHCMRDDPQLLPNRLKAFVSKVPAKILADEIGCDVRTAENIRQGHWPIARHWVGLIRMFGEDLTEAVFHPERAAQRLEREVYALERQLAEKRAAAEAAARTAARLAALCNSPENRPARMTRGQRAP